MNYKLLIDKYFTGSLTDGVNDGDKAIQWLAGTGFNFYDIILMDF